MGNRFCAGVVLYEPTAVHVENACALAAAFEQVYAVDNTVGGMAADMAARLRAAGLSIIASGDNIGLSRAYNSFCARALAAGFSHIALYDQDSEPSLADIRMLQDYINSTESDNIAVLAPQVVDLDSRALNGRVDAVDVDTVISSGSFINLALYAKTTGFDESYFIDKVDDDYCYMVRRQGYRVVQNNASHLYHKIGATKTKFGKTFGEHSPLREYYIARNTLYFKRKYSLGGVPLLWILRRIKRVMIYEEQKLAKVKMIWRGYHDYKAQIGGKYSGNND